MARGYKNPITIKSLERLSTDPTLGENVSFTYKRGKFLLAFLMREGERTPEKEELEYDVSEYTEGMLKELINMYHNYLIFGTPEGEVKPPEIEETEGEETPSESSSEEEKKEETEPEKPSDEAEGEKTITEEVTELINTVIKQHPEVCQTGTTEEKPADTEALDKVMEEGVTHKSRRSKA
jgi:hypothetical protein